MFDPKALELLPDLLESMNDSIIVDEDGKIIFFSESYAKDSGIPSKYVIGKNVKDVIVNTRLPIILQTGKDEIAEAMSAELIGPTGHHSTRKTPYHICNRIPIYKLGDNTNKLLGAFAYTSLENMDNFEKMSKQLSKIKAREKMLSQHLNEVYRPKYMVDSLLGSSSSIVQLKELISKVSQSDITVTIQGETGTGKELIASSIHQLSPRNDAPYVRINCAAIPESLLESELFGYEPGAFTGASKGGKIGKFELANNGTILLDEIGELPLSLQAKLLRVIQEKEVERIGGHDSIPLNIRLICSTNRNLHDMVAQGLFREDLYYRINVMEIKVPPLRERLDDIPELCEFFINKCVESGYGNVDSIDANVYPLLFSYPWPGNIRELEHAIECACVMCEDTTLTVDNFNFLEKKITKDKTASLQTAQKNVSQPTATNAPVSLFEHNLNHERELLENAMQICHYNVVKAARYLNISRSSLYRKLKKHHIFPYD